jgi:alpha-tubulin suppressor-like RCC1 family protein
MARTNIPKELADLFRNPDEVRRIIEFVRANEHLAFLCDGKAAPLMESDENAIIELSRIVPRFALPPQNADTVGLYLMSNGADGSETWEPMPTGGLLVLGCGENDDYQLGDNTTAFKTTFITIDASGSIMVTAGNVDSHFLKADGTIWGCGTNGRGNIGDGTLTTRQTPVQCGSDTDWTNIYPGGRDFTVAKKSGGTFWSWGGNGEGELGLGDFTDRLSPTQISGTAWASFGLGYTHNLAIKTDGTLWSCGGNIQGQLGQGDFGFLTRRHTYTQIGTDTDWAFCCGGHQHSLAIKTNGNLYAWGRNTFGQFGDGTTTTRSTTPLLIGTDTDWAAAACGRDFSVALKTDGTMWSTGRNLTGELGQGAVGDNPTWTQIGSDTDWEEVSSGELHSLARKTNGAMYGFGLNSSGEIGLGAAGYADVPTQIGTDTDWGPMAAREFHSVAIKGSPV